MKLKKNYNLDIKKSLFVLQLELGKSLVGATASNYFDSSFTVTASKHLQDQYIKDIPFLKPVKGKQNFPCLKLMSAEKVDNDRESNA